MHAQHLPAHGFQRTRWRNGAGWTREILSEPAGEQDFDWRASLADIDSDCTFSQFPGCNRELVLVSGEGGSLQFDDGRCMELAPPHGRVAFAGEDAPRCNIAGRLQVFNLIHARDRTGAELLHRPLVGPMVFLPEAGVRWLVLLIAGRATLPDHPRRLVLEQGDALLLTPEDVSPQRMVMSGGGEVLLARLVSLP